MVINFTNSNEDLCFNPILKAVYCKFIIFHILDNFSQNLGLREKNPFGFFLAIVFIDTSN